MAVVAPKNQIMEGVWAKARQGQKRIVLPETDDVRTLVAAEIIDKADLGKVILLGDKDELNQKAKEAGANIDNLEIIDPLKADKLDEYTEKFFELRKGKVASLDDAKKALENFLYFGTMMVKLDDADGMVAGASNTTADVLRPAFQIVKTAPGISLVSAYFAMIVPDCQYPDLAPDEEKGFFLYADSGGNPDPTAEELADIAITTCETIENIFNAKKAYAAMLSYSTKGSAKHPRIDKVIEATRIANEKRPDLAIDGELQGDSALVERVGKKKALAVLWQEGPTALSSRTWTAEILTTNLHSTWVRLRPMGRCSRAWINRSMTFLAVLRSKILSMWLLSWLLRQWCLTAKEIKIKGRGKKYENSRLKLREFFCQIHGL